jgi:hypothetical protein
LPSRQGLQCSQDHLILEQIAKWPGRALQAQAFKTSSVTLVSTPMIDQSAASNHVEPGPGHLGDPSSGDRSCGLNKRLCRNIFGYCRRPTTSDEKPVDAAELSVEERTQRIAIASTVQSGRTAIPSHRRSHHSTQIVRAILFPSRETRF